MAEAKNDTATTKPTGKPDTAEGLGPVEIPAAGGDPDSRIRAAKTAHAQATNADDDAVRKAQAEIDDARAELAELERQRAAAARALAGETGAPKGRSTRPKG